MLMKDEALTKLGSAYINLVAKRTIWLHEDTVSFSDEVLAAETRYETLLEVFLETETLSWDDIGETWWHEAYIKLKTSTE